MLDESAVTVSLAINGVTSCSCTVPGDEVRRAEQAGVNVPMLALKRIAMEMARSVKFTPPS